MHCEIWQQSAEIWLFVIYYISHLSFVIDKIWKAATVDVKFVEIWQQFYIKISNSFIWKLATFLYEIWQQFYMKIGNNASQAIIYAFHELYTSN